MSVISLPPLAVRTRLTADHKLKAIQKDGCGRQLFLLTVWKQIRIENIQDSCWPSGTPDDWTFYTTITSTSWVDLCSINSDTLKGWIFLQSLFYWIIVFSCDCFVEISLHFDLNELFVILLLEKPHFVDLDWFLNTIKSIRHAGGGYLS